MSSLSGNSRTEFIDGSVGVHAFTTGSQNLGTLASSPTQLRVVAMFSILSKNNTLSTISSITDSEGHTWTKATSSSQTGINNPGGLTGAPLAQGLEIWYTNSFLASSLSAPTTFTITVNTNNDIDSIAIYYSCHKDIDTTTPLDANASLPAHNEVNSGSTATATVTGKSTNTANIQVCVLSGAVGPGQRPNVGGNPTCAGSTSPDYGQGDTFHLNSNYNIFSAFVYDRTSALSSASVTNHDATNNQMLLVAAFTQDSQGAAGGTDSPIIIIMT